MFVQLVQTHWQPWFDRLHLLERPRGLLRHLFIRLTGEWRCLITVRACFVLSRPQTDAVVLGVADLTKVTKAVAMSVVEIRQREDPCRRCDETQRKRVVMWLVPPLTELLPPLGSPGDGCPKAVRVRAKDAGV